MSKRKETNIFCIITLVFICCICSIHLFFMFDKANATKKAKEYVEQFGLVVEYTTCQETKNGYIIELYDGNFDYHFKLFVDNDGNVEEINK